MNLHVTGVLHPGVLHPGVLHPGGSVGKHGIPELRKMIKTKAPCTTCNYIKITNQKNESIVKFVAKTKIL